MNRLNLIGMMSEDTMLLCEYDELTDGQRESLNIEYLLSDVVRRPNGVRRAGAYRGHWVTA